VTTVSAETFVCPRCASACSHPLEVYFRWCPRCKDVTGPPREVPEPQTPLPWAILCNAMDDCLIAIERKQDLPVRALMALPPYRAVMMARIGLCADVGLEKGTYAQLQAEAKAVGGEGTLGEWWERNP
jgi:hypothetical protein